MASNVLHVGKHGSKSTPMTLIKGDSGTSAVTLIVDRFFGGVDLAPLSWAVEIENAAGDTDENNIKAVVYDKTIQADWIPGGTATAAEGVTKFKVAGFSETDDGKTLVWQSGTYSIRIYNTINYVPGSETEAALTEVQKLIVYVDGELNRVIQAGETAEAAAESANAATAHAMPAAEAANAAATSAAEAASNANAAATSAAEAASNASTAAAKANTAAEGAEAARDNIQADLGRVSDAIGQLTEHKYVLINQGNAVFTVNPGYYTAANTGWVAGGTFISYYYEAKSDHVIFWDKMPTTYTQVSIYSGEVTAANFVARYRTADSNLPLGDSKLTVQTGQTVVFSVWTNPNILAVYTDYAEVAGITLNNAVNLNDKQLKQCQEYIAKKPKAKYIAEAGDDSSTERLEIFIPSPVGFVRYNLLHTVNTIVNANVWRVGYAYSTDDLLTKKSVLTTAGEWELAVKLKGRLDFSGGNAHGDEVMTSLTCMVDGRVVTLADLANMVEFDELRIYQTSNLYDPADNTTIVAEHGSVHIFNRNGLSIEQSLLWKVSDTLAECYMAMFPPSKTATNTYITDEDYRATTITSYPITKHNAREMTLFSADAGFTARFAVTDYPVVNGADYRAFIHDNGGGAYNKCYYSVNYIKSPSIEAGTLWRSKTEYDLRVIR